jgi:hypothetical protein
LKTSVAKMPVEAPVFVVVSRSSSVEPGELAAFAAGLRHPNTAKKTRRGVLLPIRADSTASAEDLRQPLPQALAHHPAGVRIPAAGRHSLAPACGAAHPSLVTADHLEVLNDHFEGVSVREMFGYEEGWGSPTGRRSRACRGPGEGAGEEESEEAAAHGVTPFPEVAG